MDTNNKNIIHNLYNSISNNIIVHSEYFTHDQNIRNSQINKFTQLFVKEFDLGDPQIVKFIEQYVDILKEIQYQSNILFKHSDLYSKEYQAIFKDSHFGPCSSLESNISKSDINGVFTKEVVNYLQCWLAKNKVRPYPTPEQKERIASDTRLSVKQVSVWFTNARKRKVNSKLK